jgi:hypothetical protein
MHLLLGLCGGLALLGGAEWAYLSYRVGQSRQILEQPVDSNVEFDPLGSREFVLPPKDSFSEIVERPLMIQGRRPVSEEAEEPILAGPVSQGDIQIWLMGVVMTPNGMTALLVDGKGNYKRLQIDEKFEGWEVDEMHADRVVLKQGTTTRILNLRDPNKPRPRNPAPVVQNRPPQPKPAVPMKPGQRPVVPQTLGQQPVVPQTLGQPPVVPQTSAQPPLQKPGIPNQSVPQ